MLSLNIKKRFPGLATEDLRGHATFWMYDKNQLGIPRKMYGHGGGDYGIWTLMWFDPKKKKGYILISNTGRNDQSLDAMIFIYRSLYKYGKKKK